MANKKTTMTLKNRVVIITGASAGIGKATAVLLAQAGAHVVVTARRTQRLHQLITELDPYPGQHLAIPGNIQEHAFAHTLVEQTIATFGRIDILINNAGLGYLGNLSTMSPQDIQTLFATNVFGLLHLTQAVLPYMKAQKEGTIVNISSIVGQRPLPDAAVYSATKTAVNFLSRSLRMELAAHNIAVTLVYPGLTATEFTQARLGQKAGPRLGLKGLPAEVVGKAIVKGIQNGRSHIYITPLDWLFVHISRLFPHFTDWLTHQLLQRTKLGHNIT